MIFYFSATGNTLWAAKKLAEVLGDSLVNMAEHDAATAEYELRDDERIGFCFPVHGWRPPVLVRRFISRLKIKNYADNYCWALCTAGDDIGLTMEFLSKDLSQAGISLHSVFSLIMPESYVGLPFMNVDKPEKELAKKKAAAKQLTEQIRRIENRERKITDTYKGHWPRTNSRLLGTLFVKCLITDKPFRVDGEKCIRCGKCAGVCPVDDIKGGYGMMPEWKHNNACLTCFNCYHHCPTHAIEYGRRTKNKGQYYFKTDR
ncbi:MAG: EFR1 family ferrodoxin [Prevotella sp.]|uniref:EFR1 family ferrodoxin n=1 Tax=Prevotella sp. TaxID=59823 RepID=UPI002A25BF6D|nr:EFR1 family ferrodoxin [Prevotella sp.]MDD7318510.1 EFR1 family ferrodoxin [Prevotellaceae bacterium]MDY4020315.1 EFR1 family ferrodoxin [Prevotella sp.]